MDILELELTTSVLPQQQDFYTQLFGVPPLTATPKRLSFQVGRSRLTFAHTPATLPSGYHFAFDIPENRFEDAKVWLSRRVPLMKDKDGSDEFYSESWDAHMLYFHDAAGNVVELVARHTLGAADDLPFGGQSLLNISEVGIAAEDVAAQVAHLRALTGATPYRWSGNPAFAPVGDEHGLLIVVQRGRTWFPTEDEAADHLPVKVRVMAKTGPLLLSFGDSAGGADLGEA